MKELIKICPKIQFFRLSWCFLSMEGMCLVRKGAVGVGLNGCIPWLQNTDGAICFICKEEIESVTHFLLGCSYFRNNFDSLWNKLKLKIAQSNQTDGVYICNFITNLDRNNKFLLLLGGLALPLDSKTNI